MRIDFDFFVLKFYFVLKSLRSDIFFVKQICGQALFTFLKIPEHKTGYCICLRVGVRGFDLLMKTIFMENVSNLGQICKNIFNYK